jgi:endonuclease III related protein
MSSSTTPFTLYTKLFTAYGPQHWWPMDGSYHTEQGTDPRFEIILGAILTQNTAWSNVEKAIDNLKKARILSISEIIDTNLEALKHYIKPSGFFNQKAVRLHTIAFYLKERYDGDLNVFFARPLQQIRGELLALNGIGPETADSILLYAGGKPIFVVDAYTKRLFGRLDLLLDLSYNSIQSYVQTDISTHLSIEKLSEVYNEFHALIVEHAKRYCRKKPSCMGCPLNEECPFSMKL